jgi:SAM-dependent methyltransferase
MPQLTRENVRHGLAMLRFGRRPASTVYDSIGSSFFLALDEGWLNLGLWDGDGSDAAEAPAAVRALVRTIAEPLPAGGDVLDVGNGLGVQDVEIALARQPRTLTALNITWSQLRAGAEWLAAADARPVNGDACRMPFGGRRFDGLISVEAAFHFPSRRVFFEEAFRVLRPGGVLTFSDVPVTRMPSSPREALAGVAMLRLWGIRRAAAATPAEIVRQVGAAGFTDVRSTLVGDRVIGPAFRHVRGTLDAGEGTPAERFAARTMLREAQLLWDRGILEYQLVSATKPA